jgi:hypothetical protein
MRLEVKHPKGRTLTEEYRYKNESQSLPHGSSEHDAKVVFTVLDEGDIAAADQWVAIQFCQRHIAYHV